MRLLRALIVIFAVAALAGCAAFAASALVFTQERRYVAEPASSLTPEERGEVFESFKEYWIKKGHTPIFLRQDGLRRSASFRIPPIGSGREGWTLVSDFLELGYIEGQDMVLKVSRHTVFPADFSESELSAFVAQVEATIQTASGHQVRLRLLRNGT